MIGVTLIITLLMNVKQYNLNQPYQIDGKYIYQQIQSPLNTNEYLINNHSSPFFSEEDEDSIIIKPISIIQFEEDKKTEIELFSMNDLNSTNDESVMFNEKSENLKEQMKKCLNGEKK